MTSRSQKKFHARVGAPFTPLVGMLAVVAVSYVVRRVSVERVGSEKASHAGWAAMSEPEVKKKPCTGCKNEQDAQNKAHRILEHLPVTGRMFKKKHVSVDLCEYCDGDALALAKRPSKS